MAINFRKIKSQIKPHIDKRHGLGYLFQATEAKESDDVISLFTYGRASKRYLIDIVAHLANTDAAFIKHFKFNHQ